MKQQEPGYTRRITIRLRPEEFEKLDSKRKKSTHQSLSDFARNILLSKPVTMKYRNQSADEVLSALLKIKAELSAIGNNFNQSVHKLHTFDTVPEIKTWAVISEATRQLLLKKTEEIRIRLIQIHEACARK